MSKMRLSRSTANQIKQWSREGEGSSLGADSQILNGNVFSFLRLATQPDGLSFVNAPWDAALPTACELPQLATLVAWNESTEEWDEFATVKARAARDSLDEGQIYFGMRTGFTSSDCAMPVFVVIGAVTEYSYDDDSFYITDENEIFGKRRILQANVLVRDLGDAYTRTGNEIEADANGVFAPPGVSYSVGRDILYVPDSVGFDAGLWTVIDAGSVSTKWKLRRSVNMDHTLKAVPGTCVAVTGGTELVGFDLDVQHHTLWMVHYPTLEPGNYWDGDYDILNNYNITFERVGVPNDCTETYVPMHESSGKMVNSLIKTFGPTSMGFDSNGTWVIPGSDASCSMYGSGLLVNNSGQIWSAYWNLERDVSTIGLRARLIGIKGSPAQPISYCINDSSVSTGQADDKVGIWDTTKWGATVSGGIVTSAGSTTLTGVTIAGGTWT